MPPCSVSSTAQNRLAPPLQRWHVRTSRWRSADRSDRHGIGTDGDAGKVFEPLLLFGREPRHHARTATSYVIIMAEQGVTGSTFYVSLERPIRACGEAALHAPDRLPARARRREAGR